MSLPFEAVNVVSPPVKPAARRFQITIKSIMIATAIVAVTIALSMAPVVAAIALMATHGILLCFAVIAAISGRGWIRPFAIIFGLYLIGLAIAMFGMHLPGPEAVAIVEAINLVVATIAGFCGAIFHSFLLKRNGYMPVPNIPFIRRWLVNEAPMEIKQ